VFWVISVYFNIRNTLPKPGTYLLGHPVYKADCSPLSTGALHGRSQRVTIPDAVKIQF
jgi:hypothetical protein